MPDKTRLIAVSLICFLQILLLHSCRQENEIEHDCTDSLGCVTIESGDAVHIGVLQALSGAVAPLGNTQVQGLELALDKRQGQILGHPVKLQIEDSGCTAEGGANAALKIIADPLTVAIFGTTCSGAAATASQAMSDAGLTMVSGNNSAPYLTSIGGKAAPDWQPGYFRTASNEENAGRVAAEYAYQKLNIRKAAVINDGDIYTRGLATSFRGGFEKLGGKITLFTAVNKGESEMRPVLKAVAESGAELLFFPLFQPEGNILLKQARNYSDDLNDITLMSDGALIQQTFLDDVGKLAIGMYFIGPARPGGPAAEALAAEYRKKYLQMPAVSYYLSGYDAADILLDAIEKTALQAKDGTLHIGRQALRDALYSLSDHQGVTGSLSCSQYGDCAKPVFNVLRLDDPAGKLPDLENNILYSSEHQDE